jgi:pantoate--beta-alanine ligase
MLCYKRREDIQRFLKNVKAEGKKVGFVPTMGALHQGHINLIERSRLENDLTVCSIFINPTQFNQQEDFEKYPISTAADLLLLSDVGCELVFLPAVEDIYPMGTLNTDQMDLGKLATLWEGAHRPGHFDGVAQVVGILLDIVCADNLYMGQKDLQQVMDGQLKQ